jgi:predicted nucleic acid-binding protein
MKAYWDASALVAACADLEIRTRVQKERPVTRIHSLAEIFSALTGGGNLGIRVDASEAAATIADLARDLELVELTAADVLTALKTSRLKGVRGGRVHDYLHAIAAEKQKAAQIVTVDRNDFDGLTAVAITQLD